MLSELTALIAEKTGYETSELEPDFELEADLGIDTVKQAEIFSEIREKHGLARDDDFRLADYPTIEALAGWLVNAVANGGASAAAPEIEAPAAVASESTGSPPAPKVEAAPAPVAVPAVAVNPEGMLEELTALIAEKTGYETSELEPDFELEADLGIDTVKQAEIFSEIREKHGLARDDDFRLADYPTIESLAGWLAQAIATRGDTAEAPAPAETSTETVDVEIPPAKPANTEAADDGASDGTPIRASSHDEPPFSPPLPEAFAVRGLALVEAPAEPVVDILGMQVRVLGSSDLANDLRSMLAAEGAKVGETATPQIVVDLSESVKDSFNVAKQLNSSPPERWLSVTRLGGLTPSSLSAAEQVHYGSIAGFTKALGREWESTDARVVDVSPTLDAEQVAMAILEELAIERSAVEIFRDGASRSSIRFETIAIPVPAALPDNAVVVVTGGGRGICAKVAREMARRSPLSIYLVGRGPAAEEPIDLDEEKVRIRNALKATGARVTPVEVDRRLNPLRKSEEIRQNIEAMRQSGASVDYIRVDMADDAAVRDMVRDIQARHGRIDVLIHGAGVEESRLLDDKDETAFRRVYDGKAIGGLALAETLDDDAFLVTMGSVSGRFGNVGQVDYSAANDGLARLAAGRPNTLHIDWTAWDDVGMAVRGGMKRVLTDRGVELLPADAGAALLIDMIAGRQQGEYIVAGALGAFVPGPDHPLLVSCETTASGVVAAATIDVEQHPWMLDHVIEGNPVLPGVIGLELLSATTLEAVSGSGIASIRDVSFAQPAKVYGEDPLDVQVTATTTDGGASTILGSERTLRTGRKKAVEHFSAHVDVGQAEPLPDVPNVPMPPEEFSKEDIYSRFFHGPAFQVLQRVEDVAADGLMAEGRVKTSAISEEPLHTDPLVLEAAFQAAGLHVMLTRHEMALPSKIAEVRYLGKADEDESLAITVRMVADGVYDVDVRGAQNRRLLQLRGYSMAVLGPLPPDQRFPLPDWERPVVFPMGGAPHGGSASGVIARAGAHEATEGWLSELEVAEVSSRGTERRIADRLAGRLAAKRAVVQLTGLTPSDVRIFSAETGEPLVELPSGQEAVRVTITHREGHAVAVACRNGRIGVDLEKVEQRSASFLSTWYRDAEAQAVGSDPLRQTIAWCAKEAAQKALGLGMAISPRDIEVLSIAGHGEITIRLHGQAKARERELAGGVWSVRWSTEPEDQVLVEARMVA